jgi:predicted DNA-binding transcriptional regulator AlpA
MRTASLSVNSEFQALCEPRCAVFGDLPSLGPAPELPDAAELLQADDTMLRMRDVVRITGLSKSTIKRWVADPAIDFPKPIKLTPRRLGWRSGPGEGLAQEDRERADVQATLIVAPALPCAV